MDRHNHGPAYLAGASMRLRTKVYYMSVGTWALLAILWALIANPMCIGASLAVALYWRVAEISLVQDQRLSNEKKGEQDEF